MDKKTPRKKENTRDKKQVMLSVRTDIRAGWKLLDNAFDWFLGDHEE